MRVLFFMTHAGHTRNLESTLRMLAARGHEIHVALDVGEKRYLPDLGDLLEGIAAEHPNLTVGPAPSWSKTDWPAVGTRFRAGLDYLSYYDSALERSVKFRNRAERNTPGPLSAVAKFSRTRPILRRALHAADAGTPIAAGIPAYIEEQRPNVVLITPLVQLGSPQLDYVRAARQVGVPTGLLVHSWDNLTVKGLIHDPPDLVAVWNAAQLEEAIGQHGVPGDRVAVTGAAPYDHWFGWEPSSTREAFCSRLRLDATRPIVLYVASSKFIAAREGEAILEWATDLLARRSEMPDFQVLVRPHPTSPLGDPQRRLEELEDVVVYPPNGANPTNEQARADYYDSIHHSAAVVGVNTTAFIESTIVNRPVHSLLFPRYRDTQMGAQHFRYLLPENGGMLNVARSPAEHGDQLAASLRGEDEQLRRRNLGFVESFIRPFGIDQPATPRLVEAIEDLADRTPGHVGQTHPVPALPGRVAATAGRAYVHLALRRTAHRKRRAEGRAGERSRGAPVDAITR